MSVNDSIGSDARSAFVGQPIDDATAFAWARAIFDHMVTWRLTGKQSAALAWLLHRTIFLGRTGVEYWAADLAAAIRSETAQTDGRSNAGTTVSALAGLGLVEYQPGSKLPHQRAEDATPSRVVILDPGLISPLKRGEPPKTPGGVEVLRAVNALRRERVPFKHAQNVESVTSDLAALRAAGCPAARSAESMAWLLGSWVDDAHLARAHRVREWPDRLSQWGVPLPSDDGLRDSNGKPWSRSRCLRAGRSAVRRAGPSTNFPATGAS